jgi:hypothetical protein
MKMTKPVRQLDEKSAKPQVSASLGKLLFMVEFPRVMGDFTVHYMCCTRMSRRARTGPPVP